MPEAEMDKSALRQRVFRRLRAVALRDSRFHYNFSNFIPDFQGSSQALARLMEHAVWRKANLVFITPDNCLESLRYAGLLAGKRILVTTWGILAGFVLLEPGRIPPADYLYAATLDGMEKAGRMVSLQEIQFLGKLDLLVTGASAISTSGVRIGKGHGFFDLEWAMFYAIGVADDSTPVAAVVHDVQVVHEAFVPDSYDTVCDFIFTPSQVIEVPGARKPTAGVVWSELRSGMLRSIPPLRELKAMQGGRS